MLNIDKFCVMTYDSSQVAPNYLPRLQIYLRANNPSLDLAIFTLSYCIDYFATSIWHFLFFNIALNLLSPF